MGPSLPSSIPYDSVLAYAAQQGYGAEELEMLDHILGLLDGHYREWHINRAKLLSQNKPGRKGSR
jgi:hypothetical protein